MAGAIPYQTYLQYRAYWIFQYDSAVGPSLGMAGCAARALLQNEWLRHYT